MKPKIVDAPQVLRKDTEKDDSNSKPEVSAALSRVVILRHASQTQIWIEGSKPLIFKGRPRLFWHESAIIIYTEKEKLYRYYKSNGFVFFSPTLTAMATPVEMLQSKEVIINWIPKGRLYYPEASELTALRPMKKRPKAFELDGIFKQSIVTEEQEASYDLEWSSGDSLPTGATGLSIRHPDAMMKTVWLTDLQGLTGVPSTLSSARLIDLDRDGKDEAVISISGPKGSKGFVFDKQAGIRRYVSIPSMSRTTAFSHLQQIFISGFIRNKKGKRSRALLFHDGEYRFKALSDLK